MNFASLKSDVVGPVFDTILDLIWPPLCAVCGVETRGHLCASCRAKIKARDPKLCCPICDVTMMLPDSAGFIATPCTNCLKEKPKFDKARAATTFEGPVRKLVIQMKYLKGAWLAGTLTDFLEGCFTAEFSGDKIDAVCPVPLFHARSRDRGFNQAELMGRDLAHRFKLDFNTDLLLRTRPTVTQTAMNARERRSNMAGVFVSPPKYRPIVFGRNILLVDDVMTTGSTLNECAAALKNNGAAKVFAIAVCRK